MNPFDLRGPEFLRFYVVLGGVVLVALLIVRHAGEVHPAKTFRLSDPYVIAMLRGGPAEAFKSAVVALVSRRLLEVHALFIVRRTDADTRHVKHPLERAVLEHFETEQSATPPTVGPVSVAY